MALFGGLERARYNLNFRWALSLRVGPFELDFDSELLVLAVLADLVMLVELVLFVDIVVELVGVGDVLRWAPAVID